MQELHYHMQLFIRIQFPIVLMREGSQGFAHSKNILLQDAPN
jgi:hypothetical protein